MTQTEAAAFAEAWSALGGEIAPHGVQPPVLEREVSGLASRFAVGEVATVCVSAALIAADALQNDRGGTALAVTLDRSHVAAAVRSERYFRRGAQSMGMGFAPLSRFWRSADGWVRTHANYPWHHAALLKALGSEDDHAALAAAIGERSAGQVEDAVFAAGGVAAAVRSREQWRLHAQGAAIDREPLISHHAVGDADPRSRSASPLPATGVRVLDLTRVIAGPVCTRYLGALGADVLRLDPPDRLDITIGQPADTLLAKRSALLDARTRAGMAQLHELLRDADIAVCGYRPGALERLGLGEDALAERHPGLVVVYVSAWGHTGPWAGRRGFDSVVQAATGIAAAESSNGTAPGALPCQLLDHGTGYLAAAAALDGLRRQLREGGTHVRRLSLARTAAWLTSHNAGNERSRSDEADAEPSAWLQRIPDNDGAVTAVCPPGAVRGEPLRWPTTLTHYGSDAPSW